jgi:hypothetical protein
VQGLQRALDALAAEHSECDSQVAALRSLATRFAWDDLIAALGNFADAEPA